MSLPPPKVCKKIQQLHAMLGSTSENEAGNARTKLNKLLAEHGLTWARAASASAAPQASTEAPTVNVLDLVLRLIELHIAVTPTERMAIALWILHCWLFDQFTITPRLALLSPVRRCGKTTLLALIELLVDESFRIDEVSPATVFHQIDARPNTALLVDEGDNLGLLNNRVLRSVFNSGHRKGGGVGRFVGGWSRKYLTFAPLAVAAIGMLPL